MTKRSNSCSLCTTSCYNLWYSSVRYCAHTTHGVLGRLDASASFLVCKQVTDPTELRFSIYNAHSKTFITEEYPLLLTIHGLPADIGRINKLKTIFTVSCCWSSGMNAVVRPTIRLTFAFPLSRTLTTRTWPTASSTLCAIWCAWDKCTWTRPPKARK